MIKMINIEKGYGSNRVLGPFCLDINSGEILGIVGENGAGKSTLIKLIAGIIKPDKGKIECNASGRGELGYVPQDIALYPTLTGMQNLKFFAAAAGLYGKRSNVRCKYLLKLVNLEEKANRSVSTYSGGMQHRINLACALVGDVKLLLLDEPTVGADEKSVKLILDIIVGLRESGCAVVLVSHHKDEIYKVSDRIMVIENGKLLDTGSRRV